MRAELVRDEDRELPAGVDVRGKAECRSHCGPDALLERLRERLQRGCLVLSEIVVDVHLGVRGRDRERRRLAYVVREVETLDDAERSARAGLERFHPRSEARVPWTKTASDALVELSRSASCTRCAATTDEELQETSTPEFRADARTSRGRIDPPQATAASRQMLKRISIDQPRRPGLLRIKSWRRADLHLPTCWPTTWYCGGRDPHPAPRRRGGPRGVPRTA